MKSKNSVIWVVVIVAIVGSLIWMSTSGTSNETKPVVTENMTELLTVVQDDYIKGKVGAPVTLIEYVDFECEACGAYFPLIKQLEQDFPEQLQIVIRYFPLPSHRNAMTAALAVEAAGQQGKFFEMHDLLYTEQKNWGEKPMPTPAVFEKFAEQIGLDMDKYRAAVSSPETKTRIERDVASGKAVGNTGTPSFYLNGQKLENPQGYEEFKKAIQEAIDGPTVKFGV